jgi:hypothetical protein
MSGIRRLVVAIVAVMTILFGAGIPASANTVTIANYASLESFFLKNGYAHRECGRYWPSSGKFQTLSNGVVRGAGLQFSLNAAELAALKCLRDKTASPLLEIGFTLYDIDAPYEWSNYQAYSNLPGAQKDVAFQDTIPSPAATGVRIDSLEAGKSYYATIYWNDASVTDHPGGLPRVAISWEPGHWAQWWNPLEGPAWAAYAESGGVGWVEFPTTTVYLSGGYYDYCGPGCITDGLPLDGIREYAFPPPSGGVVNTGGQPTTTNPVATPSPPVIPSPPPADVYLVQHGNSPTGMTEVKKIAVGATPPYSSWDGGWTTQDGWHSGDDTDYAMADANHDGKPDVYKIQHANTPSGMTEVQIMDGNNAYRWQGGWVTPDGLHSGHDVSYTVGDYNGDNKPDLYRILHWNTPTGHIEVQIMDASHNWQFFGGWVTPEYWHGGESVDYVLSSCGVASGGRPNLYQILHQSTASGMTEIRVFSGASNYTAYLGSPQVTVDGLHSNDDVSYGTAGCNSNGKPNIYAILHQNTNDGHAQVRVLNGAQNWTQWVGGWSTPDGLHSGNDADYVMAVS